ncbi:MAG: hypothetical protein OEZ14_13445, partial [Acidimicrobiia bacterium]|nr:hypothetical protein [Acidimicrobiia bacterium]
VHERIAGRSVDGDQLGHGFDPRIGEVVSGLPLVSRPPGSLPVVIPVPERTGVGNPLASTP